MNVNEFADAQKTHNVIIPKLDHSEELNVKSTPFVSLLDGQESAGITEERWKLYNQLHSHFHSKVDNIVSNGEVDLKQKITSLLFDDEFNPKGKGAFRTLILLGSDSTTPIDFKENADSRTLNMQIDMTSKESPNVRMMLRRSMFKVFSAAEADSHTRPKREDDTMADSDDDEVDVPNEFPMEVAYDLSLIENFRSMFGRDLNMVVNFKDVDSFNFQHITGFIDLLKNVLDKDHVAIYLVFNINTNLSMLEKNLKRSTLRFLKRSYGVLDISSNRGFKYANRIFGSFLDTVDNKLNISEKFVKFIMDKMANNTNHNLQLLTKILDYSLMSYFFENPFAVFIDPFNVKFLDESYIKLLQKCPTFMFFINDMVAKGAPTQEISNLLTNENNAVEEFFAEFLIRDNPTNRHAQAVASILEDKCGIENYNLIELYYNLLSGKLDDYLKQWPQCEQYQSELSFEPVDTIFKELFTLDNKNDLLTQAMFPNYRNNMEDDLLCWEQVLLTKGGRSLEGIQELDSLQQLNREMGPVVGELFKLYREAPDMINIYDFYTAFREVLPKELIINFLKDASSKEEELKEFIQSNNGDDDLIFDKVVLCLFMQSLFDFENIGLLRAITNNYDVMEKNIWRGL